MKQGRAWLLCVGLLLALPALAQETACPALVRQALDYTDAACTDMTRNQACYGNLEITAVPVAGAPGFQFAAPGDLVDLALIDTLQLSDFALPQNWGVMLMSVQANLPETVPGQNVTMLLFGEVALQNQAAAASTPATPFNPMQAFYFTAGIGDPQCNELPYDGILIQTPAGVGEIQFRVNEVDISLGSTVYLQAHPTRPESGGKLRVTVLEGQATLTFDGASVVVPAGAMGAVTLDAEGQPEGGPALERGYEDYEVAPLLPLLNLLPEAIAVAPTYNVLPLEGAWVSTTEPAAAVCNGVNVTLPASTTPLMLSTTPSGGLRVAAGADAGLPDLEPVGAGAFSAAYTLEGAAVTLTLQMIDQQTLTGTMIMSGSCNATTSLTLTYQGE